MEDSTANRNLGFEGLDSDNFRSHIFIKNYMADFSNQKVQLDLSPHLNEKIDQTYDEIKKLRQSFPDKARDIETELIKTINDDLVGMVTKIDDDNMYKYMNQIAGPRVELAIKLGLEITYKPPDPQEYSNFIDTYEMKKGIPTGYHHVTSDPYSTEVQTGMEILTKRAVFVDKYNLDPNFTSITYQNVDYPKWSNDQFKTKLFDIDRIQKQATHTVKYVGEGVDSRYFPNLLSKTFEVADEIVTDLSELKLKLKVYLHQELVSIAADEKKNSKFDEIANVFFEVKDYLVDEKIKSVSGLDKAASSFIFNLLLDDSDNASYSVYVAHMVSDMFLQPDEFKKISYKVLNDGIVSYGKFKTAEEQNSYLQRVDLTGNLMSEDIDKLPDYLRNVVNAFGIRDANQLMILVKNEQSLFHLILRESNDDPYLLLDKFDIEKLSDLHITTRQAEMLKRSGFKFDSVNTDEDYKVMYQSLLIVDKNWIEKDSFKIQFEKGAEIFGYKRMLEYINNSNDYNKDSLRSFDKIIKLFDATQLSVEDFWNKVLKKVKDDSQKYELYDSYQDEYSNLTAYEYLNQIANTLDYNFEGLIKITEKIPENQELFEIANMLRDPSGKIFSSWESLREFSKNTALINKVKDIDSNLGRYPQNSSLSKLYELSQIPQIGNELLDSLKGLTKFDFKKHIEPILAAQGDSAFLYFNSIKSMKHMHDQKFSDQDIDYIVYVGKKYGTRSRNILENLISKVDSIKEERQMIESFVSDIGVIDFNLYSRYKILKDSGNNEGLIHLKENIFQLQDKIYKGEMKTEDFENPLYKAVSYYAFPPAVGITQDQYEQLNESRPDRRSDVPKELDELQYSKITINTGRYTLGEDKELDLEDWNVLGQVVRKVNKELDSSNGVAKIDELQTAKVLIEMYKAGGIKSKNDKSLLFEGMYRYHLNHDGGRLDDGYQVTLQGLMKYKEFVGERIKNNLIRDCIATYVLQSPEEMENLKKDVQNKVKKHQEKNIGVVKSMLKEIEKSEDALSQDVAVKRLDNLLIDYGLSYTQIKGKKFDEYKSILIDNEEISPEDLVYRKISSDLVAGVNKSMRKEINKFGFSTEGEVQTHSVNLDFVVSKKKEHGTVGYTMGVCVTPDEKLWNDPKFWNGIFFDSDSRQSMGGIHFLIREDCLILPGINPSLDLLSSVSHSELFDKMIDKAKEIKGALGLKKLLIPVDPVIHSNRNQIQEVIRQRNYPRYKFETVQSFSYNPYPYDFQETFEVN